MRVSHRNAQSIGWRYEFYGPGSWFTLFFLITIASTGTTAEKYRVPIRSQKSVAPLRKKPERWSLKDDSTDTLWTDVGWYIIDHWVFLLFFFIWNDVENGCGFHSTDILNGRHLMTKKKHLPFGDGSRSGAPGGESGTSSSHPPGSWAMAPRIPLSLGFA